MPYRNKRIIFVVYFYEMPLSICTYESPIGKLTMLGNEQSLCYLGISQPQYAKEAAIRNNLPIFTETKHWLDIYFSGKEPKFAPKFDLCGSDFQKKVWHELLSVKFGETASYGEIAKRINCRSAQAVGQAVGKNPLLIIIPCHRIIAANGQLGGFSAGIDRKVWLLNNEKAII